MFRLLKRVVDAIHPPPIEYDIPEYVPVVAVETGYYLYVGKIVGPLSRHIYVRRVGTRSFSWGNRPFSKFYSSIFRFFPNYISLYLVGPGKLSINANRRFLEETVVYKLWLPKSVYEEYVDGQY